jgi:mono/diheme cytochrome c family protein
MIGCLMRRIREMSMKRMVAVLVVTGSLILVAEGYSQMGMMGRGGMMGGGGMMNTSVLRHQYVMHNGIDPLYASKVNPLKSKPENIQAGKKLYDRFCASCHGISGLGNGPAGKNMTPQPPNIAASSKMPMATDGYLYWTIAKGGVPLQSPMPPFKRMLKEDQIWEIILYLRVM